MNNINSIEIKGTSSTKGVWKMSFDSEDVTIESLETDESYTMARGDAEELLALEALNSSRPLIMVRLPRKKLFFNLEPAQFEKLTAWLGPPTIRGLKATLRRKFPWLLTVGILFVVTSIPLPADPEAGIEALPFDLIGATLGGLLIATSILSRIWPRPVLFLLLSAFFLALGVEFTVNIVRGEAGLWWAILVFICIITVKASISDYRRFASITTS